MANKEMTVNALVMMLLKKNKLVKQIQVRGPKSILSVHMICRKRK